MFHLIYFITLPRYSLIFLFHTLVYLQGAIVGSVCGLVFPMWIAIGSYVYKPYRPRPVIGTENCFVYPNLSTPVTLLAGIDTTVVTMGTVDTTSAGVAMEEGER